MKVSNIQVYLLNPHTSMSGWIGGKNLILTKVDTDTGITGWGEAYSLFDRDKAIVQSITELGRYLIGNDPFHIKQFSQMAYNDFAGKRGSMELFCSLSCLEQAMWDIVGKHLDTPVYNLLGGPCRDRIRVYANGWYGEARTPEEFAVMAVNTVKRGFTALKFDPFPGLWRLFISKEDEELAVENVRAVRKAVGDDIDILVEVHRRLAPMHANRFAKMIEDFRPFWFEEPVSSENVDALAEVRRNTNIPIVTGETLYSKAPFREVLEKRAADILNPDVASCGGILELKEIAAMAEPCYVGIAPHNYNSTTIALAATLQVSAAIPNFIITEYFINFSDFGQKISQNPFKVENGYIKLPTSPGLGLEINETVLKEFGPNNLSPRKFTF